MGGSLISIYFSYYLFFFLVLGTYTIIYYYRSCSNLHTFSIKFGKLDGVMHEPAMISIMPSNLSNIKILFS